MYAICGATGNIGRAIAEQLLAQGKKVRAIGRSAEKLQSLTDKGAEAIVADLLDTDAIADAFTGVEAVYAMIPPNMTATDYRGYQNEVGKSLADAIRRAGVKFVVNLSSVGANKPDGMGVVNGLYDQEQRLNRLEDTNVIHLRPTFFMENHLWQIESIKQHGVMATPQDPDVAVAQIATSDVADYAVARMTELDFEGKVTRDLLGPADVSMNDVATAIGQAIGKKDLKFTRVSFGDSRNHMIGMGISESVADGLVDVDRAISDGSLRPTETRSPENSTPTTVDEFSRIFVQFYKN
jgi:uncharacterized protein YbjT (DUF2867 family)